MAKRRKVGNLLGLHILATLSIEPMHPYEMAARLKEFGKDQDIKIQWGSLYTVVQNLEKHGFIEAAETVRDGRRPERTVYRLTGNGRAELTDWMRELVGTPAREFPKLQAALSVLGVLPPDEVITLLEQRLATLAMENDRMRADLDGNRAVVPRLFLVEAEYRMAIRDAEVTWLTGLLTEMREGTMAGLAAWRRIHRTGEMPTDLSEFMTITET
ncbi:PadR family transcriptional regulator [Actinoplanes sp. SE50]|uniref:PadR family transcriptional regulator n=1 Tax=unclassified Actinoplanes TaxID=2626549 RepID=UPI00023ECE3C|nr:MULTISPECIES: PadR family transcriptional regulator [unclassified Actinoplanes]AEV83242.1 transcriptional regulator, PadR-like family [Actinoplanes sp. SE50/110]ATO81635.1 PadR family transcriptional regulator [Actinoplanes sp. SE50]SLL99043.1 PadR family transcriptional regulator [Actinoplanes sp. SE50/110]